MSDRDLEETMILVSVGFALMVIIATPYIAAYVR